VFWALSSNPNEVWRADDRARFGHEAATIVDLGAVFSPFFIGICGPFLCPFVALFWTAFLGHFWAPLMVFFLVLAAWIRCICGYDRQLKAIAEWEIVNPGSGHHKPMKSSMVRIAL